jgi:mannose-6-phosphate isomerase-like protein (cupin superfamily)
MAKSDMKARLLVVGIGADGRSCIVEHRELIPEAVTPGTSIMSLFTTDRGPLRTLPAGLGTYVQDRLSPGQVSWRIIIRAPGSPVVETATGTGLRYKNTIEFAVVLEGSGELVLGDGSHAIRVGDCIVLPGSDHALRAGAEGCRLMAFDIGMPPPG